MTVIDTNVILRYLLNDIQEQADKASKIIEEGAKSYPEIVAEVVYVLVKLYSVPREKINEIISPITYEITFENAEIIRSALENFHKLNLILLIAFCLPENKY